MALNITQDRLQPLSGALTMEWLETNGLGGWAGSTLHGCHTRRYHGLLMAAVDPPAGRMLCVSRLDETICLPDRPDEPLYVREYEGGVLDAPGETALLQFSKDIYPEWVYRCHGIKLRKSILMPAGANCTLIRYEVLEAPGTFMLRLRPFAGIRGYHELKHFDTDISWQHSWDGNLFRWQPYSDKLALSITVPGSEFVSQPDWYYRFEYRVEKYRGLDSLEDLATPGYFQSEVGKGEVIWICLAAGEPAASPAEAWESEINRRRNGLQGLPGHDTIRQLALAADQFIVHRGKDWRTVIAGYHWFTDWGRDTMISLPGLCLSTRRYDDARKILSAFADSVSMGMLPNRFTDNGEAPEYNTVDGTLWFFISIYKYWQATGDDSFVLDRLLPILKSIIDWHFRGTRYGIKADGDGLLHAGVAGQQLTWMDARIGDWVVTPRMGKPVEVQALWYNALKIFAILLERNNQPYDARLVEHSAVRALEAFGKLFWNEAEGYLYDVMDDGGNADGRFRPNQLLALSLPFPLIAGDRAARMLRRIRDELLTPLGLRSLSPSEGEYIPVYGGDAFRRDSAYHQGTVWTWLLGPYIDALMQIGGPDARGEARQLFEGFHNHLLEAGIGSVSEIADASAPHHPRGCIAQAWGVAEWLRVALAYRLYEKEPAASAGVRQIEFS